MEKICYIVGAGPFEKKEFHPTKEDYIIAADGGYNHLKEISISPDMLVGDFDSLEEIPNHPNMIRHPQIKDDTDMLLAIKKGLEAGYKTFYIFGGIGNRLDHTIANVQLLSYLTKQGATPFLFGEEIMITAITNTEMSFSKNEKGMISVFCHGDKAKGVTIKGLKYELSNATVTSDYPIGISNEFIGKESRILVKEGTLIIMKKEEEIDEKSI